MRRLIIYIALSLAITIAISWILTLEGNLLIDFAGYRLQPSVGLTIIALIALILLSIILWAIIRRIIYAPKKMAQLAKERKKESGIKALNEGYIALLSGDGERARKMAKLAKEKLMQNNAAKLLEARADLMIGNMAGARENYRALIADPNTSLAALHGLFEQAKAQNNEDAAFNFASKAFSLAPNSVWAQQALFRGLTKEKQWQKALNIVQRQIANSPAEKTRKNRKLAILHTAIAKDLEESDPFSALHHVKIALKLLPNFVPAALIGAQVHINKNEQRKASSLLRRVWNNTHHPHIALLYINAQPGISSIEKLKRAKQIIDENSNNEQDALILANSAIEAFEWSYARKILQPFLDDPTQNMCLAMAKIEEGQNNDEVKAKYYLSKAVHARRDKIWVGDGIISDIWLPTSPISGKFDIFEWKTPPSALPMKDNQADKGEDIIITPSSKEANNKEIKQLNSQT